MGLLQQMSAGSFTADGNPRVIEFAGSPDVVRLYYQGNASGDVWLTNGAPAGVVRLKELYWNRNMAEGSGLGTQNLVTGTADEKVFLTGRTGVSRFVPSWGSLGTPIVVTSVSKGNPANVLATAHGLVTGDIVLMQSVADMSQINGLAFQVTRVDADNVTLNGLDSSGFADPGVGGTMQRVLYPYVWMPVALSPIAITQAANAVITTSFDHRYVAGQFVLLAVPRDFGMVQADQKVAKILSVTSNTLTVDLNTASFTAFAFPPSGAPLGQPSVTNYASSTSQILNQYRNDGFSGIYLGSTACGTSGLVHYEILQADIFKKP